MSELITEKRTQLEYKKEKFKKRHGFIPDYSKDPYGNTGTIIGDDGNRIDFSFSGGTTKKTKYQKINLPKNGEEQKEDKGSWYKPSENRIEMVNQDFNPRVKGYEDYVFNHEYGHAKVNRKRQQIIQGGGIRNTLKNAQNYGNLSLQAKSYAQRNQNYKDEHDANGEETIADVNGIINTKNGEKVYRKGKQDSAKQRAKFVNNPTMQNHYKKVFNNVDEENRQLKSEIDRLKTQKVSGIRNNIQKNSTIKNMNKKIDLNTNGRNRLQQNLRVQPTTDRYRYQDNMAATQNPTLRNFANNK